MGQLAIADDRGARCRWSAAAPDFLAYHDEEWGFPVADDQRLFEKLSLEGFQSGLSWRTILAKREHFRAAFCDFDFDRIARFTPCDVDRLLRDEGIVRHRGKIEAVINNARQAQELVRCEGSLAAFIWRYEPAEEASAKPQTCLDFRRIRCPVDGTQETGLEICRSDHSLRLHAGDGPGQRSCRAMLRAGRGRTRAQAFQAAFASRIDLSPPVAEAGSTPPAGLLHPGGRHQLLRARQRRGGSGSAARRPRTGQGEGVDRLGIDGFAPGVERLAVPGRPKTVSRSAHRLATSVRLSPPPSEWT